MMSQYTLIKQSLLMDINIPLKQSHTVDYIHLCVYFKLSLFITVGLEKGQDRPRPHIIPTSKNLGIFLTYELIPLLNVIFALA